MIAENGALVPPTPDARPLAVGPGAVLPVTIENPPGLYGTEEGVFAHNLLKADAVFTPLVRPQVAAPVTELRYAFDESRDLKGPLVAAALVLMLLDTLAVFWMGGLFARRPRKAARATGTVAAVILALGFALALPDHACGAGRQAGRRRSHRGDFHDAHRLCADRRRRRRFHQPRRPVRPVALPDRKDGAGARRACRRRHRQGRTLVLPAHLLADRRQCPDADRSRHRPHRRLYAGRRHGSLRHARPIFDRHRRRLGKPGHGAPARHREPSQRAAAGAGARRSRADQILLHPSGVSRPLQRQPALGRGVAGGAKHRKPAGPHRRRRHPDHDHRQ